MEPAAATALPAGTYAFGPEHGTLAIKTGRTGAAAKAGHDLLLHVTAWQAVVEVGDEPAQTSVVLDVDPTSLRVREGTGGMQALGDDDRASIEATIDDDVLKRQRIAFRSTSVEPAADGFRVEGELTLLGTARPVTLELAVAGDGRVSGSAVVTQSDWGIKPYSTLFGALKVADAVEVLIDAAPSPAPSPTPDKETAPWP
jgi:polyisoprenoid-binding protein YceI